MNGRPARLAVECRGTGSIPVVFLHGFLGSASDWAAVTTALGASVWSVVVDLPGHGSSVDLGDEEAYRILPVARGLGDLLGQLSSGPAVLVGYSMGGRLALHTALAFPDRICGLFLESASPGISLPEARAARLELDRHRAEDIVRDLREFLRRWYAAPLFASMAATPGLREEIERRRLQNRPEELARAVVGFSPGSYEALWDRLGELRCPVLILAGSEDERYVDIARSMAAVSPRIETAVLPGAGHNVHLEKPGPYVDTLKRFLSRCGVR